MGTILALAVGIVVAIAAFFVWRAVFKKVGLIGWIAVIILFFVGLIFGLVLFGSL